MSFSEFLQYIFSGITNGSIYAVVAIGYNIIYNTTGIINFAQGEFLMLGGMSAVSLNRFLPLPLAILGAVCITALVGVCIDIGVIRRLRRPTVLNMIITTIGLSILLREAALHVWDEKVRSLPYFTGTEISSIRIGGAYISPQVLWVLGICGAMVLLLTLFFRYTITGRAMRACAASPVAARLCGIHTGNMVTLSFLLSAAIGAVAGCVISPIAQTQYDCGTSLAVKGFAVAILGGLGNSAGAVLGGVCIGIIEALSIIAIPLAYQDAVAIAILLIILFFRPAGLLGRRELTRLKEY